jgi:hypothetical protein
MTRIDPGLTGAVLQPDAELHLTEEGWIRSMRITMPPELFDQYRSGYRCPRCHSVQSTAFPVECETVWRDTGERCGFPIKDKLNDWLEFEFRGEESLWPDREDALGDEREREDWQARNGIWIPGKE